MDSAKCYDADMHVLRHRYGHAVSKEPMNAETFVAALRTHLRLDGRRCSIRITPLRLVDKQVDDVYVNFINLPEGIGSAGGGAEAENNRASFWIRGFGYNGAPSASKIRVEESNTVFERAGYKLRAKSAAPEVIAQYLGDFISKIVAEVPPNFTHTKA